MHQVQKCKGHLDRFSHFAGLTIVTDRQTQTDRQITTPSVTIGLGHIYVYSTVIRWPILQMY